MSRREVLAGGLTAGLAAWAGGASLATVQADPPQTGKADRQAVQADASSSHAALQPIEPTFRLCLNTSTIRGQKLSLVEEIELAARAGYDGIEPWLREIDAYVEGGGQLADLKKRLDDHGLVVESAIGFANWIVDDDSARRQGLEQARRDMDRVAALGGTRIAAPPVGATQAKMSDPSVIAARYRALTAVGREAGVTPQLEVWGFSATMNRLSEVLAIAAEVGEADTLILPDVYHLIRGGNPLETVSLLSRTAVQVFHVNDVPPDVPADKLTDAMRVYPGYGVADVPGVLRQLAANGFTGALSLELFNPTYWEQDAETVVTTGLAAMKRCVAQAART